MSLTSGPLKGDQMFVVLLPFYSAVLYYHDSKGMRAAYHYSPFPILSSQPHTISWAETERLAPDHTVNLMAKWGL